MEPEIILPQTRILGAVWWEVEEQVRSAQEQQPRPEDCPVNRLFMVPELRSAEIHLAIVSCHPGVKRTLYQVQQRFWWPSMSWDILEYVMACPTYTRNKFSNTANAELLQQLSISRRPWSHISLDFVARLLPSDGYTVILMIVDRIFWSHAQATHSQENC